MDNYDDISSNYIHFKSKKSHGFQKVREQYMDKVVEKYGDLLDCGIEGTTPIEKVLFLALKALISTGTTEYEHLLVAKDYDHGQRLLNGLLEDKYPNSYNSLLIIPQFRMEGRRADFLISSLASRCSGPKIIFIKLYLRYLLVECDGHDFHEKTKEQAALDKGKDRQASIDGYDTFRFTGSEIWKDPMGCASQIVDWALEGF